MRRPTAAMLVVGNELLTGKIADRNVVVLARALRGLGVTLRRVVVVPDEREIIVEEVRALAAAHDHVFTSGGVGPTHDDVTVAAVAEAFGAGLVRATIMEDTLRAHYGDALRPGHLEMAKMPDGARLVAKRDAQGLLAVWPTIVMRNVWLLPGVPEIFERKMEVLPEELQHGAPFFTAAVYTTLDEGTLKAALDRVVEAFPDVEIGSYPIWRADHRTKLTFDGADGARVTAARDAFVAGVPAESVVRVE